MGFLRLALSLAITFSTSCTDTHAPFPEWDASIDFGPAPGVDSDGDALCDITEGNIGSDPNNPDSDADSFPDDVEWRASYDPLAPAEPPRENVIYVRETATEPLSVTIVVPVRGEGEVFQGFVSSNGALRDGQYIATDFVATGYALDAYPRANVNIIDTEAERFIGVEGRTQLVFSVAFGNGDNDQRDCLRAFPFRYTVKTDLGNIVASIPYLLVVAPDPTSEHVNEWCSPTASCS